MFIQIILAQAKSDDMGERNAQHGAGKTQPADKKITKYHAETGHKCYDRKIQFCLSTGVHDGCKLFDKSGENTIDQHQSHDERGIEVFLACQDSQDETGKKKYKNTRRNNDGQYATH